MDRHDDSTARAGGMGTLVVRVIRLPFDALLFGVEIVAATLRGLQRLTGDGGGGTAAPPRNGVGPSPRPYRYQAAAAPAANPDSAERRNRNDPHNCQKEPATMPDTNLNDDMLKLVRYKILFVRRDYEVAFPEQEEFVSDNMTETAFTAWKIAEFIQSLAERPVPVKWVGKKYPHRHKDEAPKDMRDAIERDSRHIHWLPEGDKKFLRVYFEVLQRYTREKLKQEVEVLEEIRDALRDKHTGTAAAATGSASSSGKGGGRGGGASETSA